MERSEIMNAREAWLVREREINKGGEGVYILPLPKMTVVYFLVDLGSSGVTLDNPG